jgi:hypothetical protein
MAHIILAVSLGVMPLSAAQLTRAEGDVDDDYSGDSVPGRSYGLASDTVIIPTLK